ncbi:MAG: hypothetical protein WBP93_01735 [Pyrinomonadaceae bacterium]
MAKWCISLILLLVLAGNALAGVNAHWGEKKCPMTGAEDCCKKAESQNTTPEVYAARLCCSLNCTVPGTTAPTSNIPSVPSPTLAIHSALVIPSTSLVPVGLLAQSRPERKEHSPPIYIQHLALLI